MSPINETADDPGPGFAGRGGSSGAPGLVLVWTAGSPTCRAIPLPSGGHALHVGRTTGDVVLDTDERVSSRHASFALEGTELVVRDLGSRNGTFLSGARVDGAARVNVPRHPPAIARALALLPGRGTSCASAARSSSSCRLSACA